MGPQWVVGAYSRPYKTISARHVEGWAICASARREDHAAEVCGTDTSPAVRRGVDFPQPPQGVAPTARARCRHVGSQGQVAGRCRTMRRTVRSTKTERLISRSLNV